MSVLVVKMVLDILENPYKGIEELILSRDGKMYFIANCNERYLRVITAYGLDEMPLFSKDEGVLNSVAGTDFDSVLRKFSAYLQGYLVTHRDYHFGPACCDKNKNIDRWIFGGNSIELGYLDEVKSYYLNFFASLLKGGVPVLSKVSSSIESLIRFIDGSKFPESFWSAYEVEIDPAVEKFFDDQFYK